MEARHGGEVDLRRIAVDELVVRVERRVRNAELLPDLTREQNRFLRRLVVHRLGPARIRERRIAETARERVLREQQNELRLLFLRFGLGERAAQRGKRRRQLGYAACRMEL